MNEINLLKEKIENLEKRIENLEKRIENLEKRIEERENRHEEVILAVVFKDIAENPNSVLRNIIRNVARR